MSGFYSAAVTVCAAGLCCALLSVFVSDQSLKRVLSLCMGAFLVCSLIVPVKNAVGGLRTELEDIPSSAFSAATADESTERRVIGQAEQNLANTLRDLLTQNGISINDCAVSLKKTEENSIIIGEVCIYIGEEASGRVGEIKRLTAEHFGKTAQVITE